MPTVNATAGADSAPSSSLWRSCINVSAVAGILSSKCQAAGCIETQPAGRQSLLLRNQAIEALVGIGAGLIDWLLIQDQILHRLPDELARFRIGDDGIADL